MDIGLRRLPSRSHAGNSISVSRVDQYTQSHTATVILTNGPAA